ncbi:MAG: CDP-4-dehydro-6-deoxyglucose reductase [Bacteroidota bacterium]|nr:CDP-4-dehydro-6-deoxyglucose reductase [Bacteroidota bacterium]
MQNEEYNLRQEIFRLAEKYYELKFKGSKFIPGESPVRYAGRHFDEKEIIKLLDSSLDFWLTEGRFCEELSGKIGEFLPAENVLLTTSGSSANLLAFAALTSEKLGERRIKPGDEVISAAAGFPTTVTPIIQYNAVPVFCDVELTTYNVNIEMFKKAISPKTKCIFLAHTHGNPYNLDEIMEIADKRGLWVIEDNCDAFGSLYDGKHTGTFGHISTISFYPAHHITCGEGGAVVTNDELLAQIIRSFKDWGRDCYCAGGENNTCGKRFTQQFGGLPLGYDHKFVYSEIGYNLKMTEMQAAVGSAQMDKLESFCEARRHNFREYMKIFSKYEDYLILPKATEKTDPSWFTFLISVKEDAPFTRTDFVKYLNENKIETRNLFAGNLTKQPAFINKNFRVADSLEVTDYIMNNTFFIGVYPGITSEMLQYVDEVVGRYINKY